MRYRTVQIKLMKDTESVSDIARPQNPENTTEAKAIEVIQNATGCVVLGYTICKSVDFFYRMAEHYLVK